MFQAISIVLHSDCIARKKKMSVILKCVKVDSKLRIRIVSPNYFNEHNCQFPRAIRVENTLYEVPASDVRLINNGFYRSFYRIKRKNIHIIDEADDIPSTSAMRGLRVFQDEDEVDCAICLSEPKHYVFGPCGHFHVCRLCANQIKQCPICRSNIAFKIDFRSLKN